MLNRVLLRQQTRRSATSVLLRPVFVLGVLSLAGATAGATIGRRAWSERSARLIGRSEPSAPVAQLKRARPVREPTPIVAEAMDEAPAQTCLVPNRAMPVRANALQTVSDTNKR